MLVVRIIFRNREKVHVTFFYVYCVVPYETRFYGIKDKTLIIDCTLAERSVAKYNVKRRRRCRHSEKFGSRQCLPFFEF